MAQLNGNRLLMHGAVGFRLESCSRNGMTRITRESLENKLRVCGTPMHIGGKVMRVSAEMNTWAAGMGMGMGTEVFLWRMKWE